MGLIRGLRDYFRGKRLKKLKKDILALRSELTFDPGVLILNYAHRSREAFSRRIMEYKVWNIGNSALIRLFYTTGNAKGGEAGEAYGKMNYFWAQAPKTARMIHSGIPGLISTRMADILFKSGISAAVTVYKNEEGNSLAEDKTAEKLANELLQTLMEPLNVQENLQMAATNESWGGHCFFKLSHDVAVSEFPILENYDITKAEIIKERGITKAIVFKKWYEHGNCSYRLDEIYSVTQDGDACITYRLFALSDGREKEVDLLSIPQTAGLFNVNGRGAEDGIHLDGGNTFVYEGVKGMLAFEKPNKTPSLEFSDSPYGASDYEGAVDNFDALDEVTSGNIAEIRRNATKRYVPDEFIPRDENGRPLPLDDFADSYVRVRGDADQDANNKIEVVQVGDKTESFLGKWKSILSVICNKAKISPYSLGITWLEAVGPSAESQRERNKTTLDMREGKLKLWRPLLEKLFLQALQLNSWMRRHCDGIQESVPDVGITWANASVKVEFGEYLEDSLSEKLTAWGAAKAQRIASTDECVRRIHPEWTEAEVADEVNRIRFEEGMSTDTPDSLPALTGSDETDGEE